MFLSFRWGNKVQELKRSFQSHVMSWRWRPWPPTSLYQGFSQQGWPLSSLRSGSSFILFWIPFLSGFLNLDAINQYGKQFLPYYWSPNQLLCQVQEEFCTTQGPAFAEEVTVGLVLAGMEQKPYKRLLLLAWFPLGSAEGVSASKILSQELNTSSKQKPDTEKRGRSIHFNRQSEKRAGSQPIGPQTQLIVRTSL